MVKTERKENEPLAMGHYAALFLDILNQKNKLSSLSMLPATPADRPAFISALKETVGVVNQYREAFDTYLTQAGKARDDLRRLSPEAYEQFRKTTEIHLKKVGFSDSILCYAPLMEIGDRIPVFGVLHLMYAASGVFLAGLADGCPCRGGLEVGVAGTFPEVGFYGPVLYQAYDLESKVAGYPRIVIGKEFISYIQSIAAGPANSPKEVLRCELAKTCVNMIFLDTDGIPCLDYLGKPIRELMDPEALALDEVVGFAKAELERFRGEGDFKHAERYHRLNLYLDTRIRELWGREL